MNEKSHGSRKSGASTTRADGDSRHLVSVGWVLFGVAALVGVPLGRAHAVIQAVRIAAILVLVAALAVAARERSARNGALAALGVAAAALVTLTPTAT